MSMFVGATALLGGYNRLTQVRFYGTVTRLLTVLVVDDDVCFWTLTLKC